MHLEYTSDMIDSDPEDLFFNWTHVHCAPETNGATAQRNSFQTSVQHEVERRKQGLVRMVNVYFADKGPLIFFLVNLKGLLGSVMEEEIAFLN